MLYRLVGGCYSGQVVLWEIPHTAIVTAGKSGGGGKVHSTHKEGESSPTAPAPPTAGTTTSAPTTTTDTNKSSNTPHSNHALNPKFISAIDRSHKKCVTDVYWLPPTIQLNHLGKRLLSILLWIHTICIYDTYLHYLIFTFYTL